MDDRVVVMLILMDHTRASLRFEIISGTVREAVLAMLPKAWVECVDAHGIALTKLALLAQCAHEDENERALRRYRRQTSGWPPIRRFVPRFSASESYVSFVLKFVPLFIFCDLDGRGGTIEDRS